jgi:hypothetical protein
MICTYPACKCADGCFARSWNERAANDAPCTCCYCKDKRVRQRVERIREVVAAASVGAPFPPPPGRAWPEMKVERVKDEIKLPLLVVPLKWLFDRFFPVKGAHKV